MEKIHFHFFQFIHISVKPFSGHYRDLKTVPVIESHPLHRGSRVSACQGIGTGKR